MHVCLHILNKVLLCVCLLKNIGGNYPCTSVITTSVTTTTPGITANLSDAFLAIGVPLAVCMTVIIAGIATTIVSTIVCLMRKKTKRKQGGLMILSGLHYDLSMPNLFPISDVSSIEPEENPCYSTIGNLRFSIEKNAAYAVVHPVNNF